MQNIWFKMYMLIYYLALDTVMWESFHLLSLVTLSLLPHLAEFFLAKKRIMEHYTLVLLFVCVWKGEGSKS